MEVFFLIRKRVRRTQRQATTFLGVPCADQPRRYCHFEPDPVTLQG